ncbi:MAG: hypothetical protein IMF14_07385, partial [Proteobacteria bacterium]|nr:hypothetical protein [Pseudomonadota bacterium]
MAVVLISAAVLFSVLRAVLPHATGYKNEIQQEISRQIGLPVEIESIDAAIHWFSPRLKLIRVSVFDKKNKVPLFDFREAFVELDVFESLVRQEIIIADVGLIGADISIEKFSEKEWSVQGVRFTSGGSSELPAEFLYMIENADYLLHDSNIYYQDHTGDKLTISLLNVNIDVENNFNTHDIKFSMLLPEAFGGQLSAVADLSGKLEALHGDIFIEAEQLKIRQWNEKFRFLKEHQLDALVDIRLWATLENNTLRSLTTSLQSSDVSIKNNKTKKIWKTDYLAGDFRYLASNGHWNVTLSDFYFGKELEPAWGRPVTVLASDDAEKIYLSADFLRIADLQNIAEAAMIDEYQADFEKLKAYRLSADIYNLDLHLPKKLLVAEEAEGADKHTVSEKVVVGKAGIKTPATNKAEAKRGKVEHGASKRTAVPAEPEKVASDEAAIAVSEGTDGETIGDVVGDVTGDTNGEAVNKNQAMLDGLYLQATVTDFSLYDHDSGLTLTGFDAALNFDDSRLTVDVATENAGLQLPDMLRESISIDTIHGELKLDYDGESFHLAADDLQLRNKHFNTFSRLDVRLSSMDDIFVDVQTDFYEAYGKYVHHYLPVGVMDTALVEWLDIAVVDGYIPEGSVILQGNIADFPFKDKSGIFQALFSPRDVSLVFLEDWPPLTGASASIKFNNLSLYVRDTKARTQTADLYDGYAEILNLPDPHLTVKTKARSTNHDVQSYVWSTPLDEILGDTLRLFEFSGKNKLDLILQVPLNQEQIDVVIDGHLTFIDTTMRYTDLGYELNSLNGVVDFTNTSIFADSVNAEIQGRPVLINAFTQNADTDAGRQVFFHLDGPMDADYLLQRYDWIPKHWVSGVSQWSIDVEVPHTPETYLVRVEASSYLEGVVLQMSDKVSKVAAEKMSLSTEIDIKTDDSLYIQAMAHDSNEKKLIQVHADRSDKRVWNFDVQSA